MDGLNLNLRADCKREADEGPHHDDCRNDACWAQARGLRLVTAVVGIMVLYQCCPVRIIIVDNSLKLHIE